jgi:isochorismate synthase EntC
LNSNRIETDAYRPALEGRLGNLLREASERAHHQGLLVLASLTEAIPLEVFGNAAAVSEERTLWLQPDSGFSITSAGAAYVVESAGSERFAQAAAAWEGLSAKALIEGSQESASGPLLIGGFSFDAGAAEAPLRRAIQAGGW